MSKQTATTVHGEVSYETVDCYSCGNEVAKEDSVEFVVGDVQDERYWSHKNAQEIEFDKSTMGRGWVCEYCRDTPVYYPPRKLRYYIAPEAALFYGTMLLIVLMAVTAVVFSALGV